MNSKKFFNFIIIIISLTEKEPGFIYLNKTMLNIFIVLKKIFLSVIKKCIIYYFLNIKERERQTAIKDVSNFFLHVYKKDTAVLHCAYT